MRKSYSYLIWIMPGGVVKRKFSRIINSLSKKYNSPRFVPHVTLLGSFEGIETELIIKAEKYSKLIKPFEVNLTKVACLNEFFRSLFILVKKNKNVIKNHEIGRKLFGMPSKKYLPHLSLIYGNFDKKTKKVMIKAIGEKFNSKFKVNSIYLVRKDEVDTTWTIIKKLKLII